MVKAGWSFRRQATVLLLASVSAASVPAADPPAPPTEYEVKAAFLYNFARFVEWPPRSGASGGPFVVAVLGADPFGPALDRAFSGKTVRGQRAEVRRVEDARAARDAEIVFVSSSEEPRLAQVLAALDGTGALTVGEMDEFAQRGGMIGFRMDHRRVRFDINAQRATRAGLRVSSDLLKLARVVGGAGGGL